MRGKKRELTDMPDDEGEWSKPKRMKSSSSTEGEEESRDVTPTDNLPDPNAEHKKLGKLSKFRISKVTRKKLKEKGMRFLFPIQYKTFDHVYDGRDVIGQARTGTGKTLSFVLPLLEKLIKEGISNNRGRPPMVLVMAPTRELVNQVHEEVKALAGEGVASHCVYGGSPYGPQESAMRNGLDIVVGTPGRILDHMRRGLLKLGQLKHVVLDEADQMLERGFAESVEEILAASFENSTEGDKPQLLLFSATVPSWVQDTADRYMSQDKVLVDLIGQQSLRTAVTVEHLAICCPYAERPSTIADVIQVYSGAHGRTMIFCPTKKEANEMALSSCLKQDCQVLHGDIPQRQREITLKGFREGKYQVLVATDVAARGLDIPEVDLVVQCEPPKDVDAYIHRSGRTGRAGRTGVCLLFYKPQQEHLVKQVERIAGISFQRIGAPQPVDIIKAGAKDSIRSLDSIPESVLALFREAATQLIDGRGAIDVVAAALAHMSGAKEITSRSLLSSHQGYTTYHT
ncbi:nucleolar RNA helicase 2-like isoform X2 [Halichondria panicea]|uniref:nucleolar RNA helicase 2-like isoform X2 n=1 Tax=Halichondria panicea TaxID=6063 RepID=UPI00312BC701